jgi:hypothetical protein
MANKIGTAKVSYADLPVQCTLYSIADLKPQYYSLQFCCKDVKLQVGPNSRPFDAITMCPRTVCYWTMRPLHFHYL